MNLFFNQNFRKINFYRFFLESPVLYFFNLDHISEFEFYFFDIDLNYMILNLSYRLMIIYGQSILRKKLDPSFYSIN